MLHDPPTEQQAPRAEPRATITNDPGGKAERRWLLVATLGGREVIRRRFLSRDAAVQGGANFLAYNDERYVRARLMADDLLRRVTTEHERHLDATTLGGGPR